MIVETNSCGDVRIIHDRRLGDERVLYMGPDLGAREFIAVCRNLGFEVEERNV